LPICVSGIHSFCGLESRSPSSCDQLVSEGPLTIGRLHLGSWCTRLSLQTVGSGHTSG
ncbi:unnamed protein product, partial [Linum tenue]